MALNFPAHQHKVAWIGKHHALEFTPKRLEPYTPRDKPVMNSEQIIPLVGVYSGQIRSIHPQGWADDILSCVIVSCMQSCIPVQFPNPLQLACTIRLNVICTPFHIFNLNFTSYNLFASFSCILGVPH